MIQVWRRSDSMLSVQALTPHEACDADAVDAGGGFHSVGRIPRLYRQGDGRGELIYNCICGCISMHDNDGRLGWDYVRLEGG